MLPEIGHKFGPYEILGKLGGGGMGVVFRAWDDRLHREVAVKLLHDEFQAPGMRQRFLLEARAASALNHPHICTIFDMGEQDGEPFLVMEILEGITLKERIAQGACSSEEIVRFGSEIADALSAAHSRGIVHRDIKPANIFLQGKMAPDRQVKVLDFGLAKVSMALRSGRDSRALELTAAGSTVGTLAYMSPEQARGEHLDLRSDLFSLGIVLYEMATRRTPFRGATTALAFQSLLTGAPDPIRTWNVSIPRELERIITRLLLKDRSERFQTAREVEDALRKLASRGDGDWLRKLPRPEVPLVPSLDPIARNPRKLRGRSESEQEQIVAAANALTPIPKPSENPDFIRPRRMPTPENRPRDVSISRNSIVASPTEKIEQIPNPSNPSAPTEGPAALSEPNEPANASRPPARSSGSATPGKAASGSPSSPPSGPSAIRRDVPSLLPKEVAATFAAAVTAPSDSETDVPSKAIDSVLLVPASVNEDPPQSVPHADTATFSRSRRTISTTRIDTAAAAVSVNASPEELQPRKATTALSTWLLSAGVLAAVLLSLGLFLTRSGSFGQIVLSSKDTILLAPLVNRTGDGNLDDVVVEGLEIELTQSSHLHWLGLSALYAGKTQAAAADHVSVESISPRAAAQRLGARAYLYGELSRADVGYLLHLDIVDVASNDRLGSFSESAPSKNDLLDAITRLSVALRQRLGDTAPAGKAQPSTPLGTQATANLGALNLYAKAQTATANGDLSRATDLYEQAASEAPGFALAELHLAEVYARDGAEIAAARSASRALASSSRTGDRVAPLAQIAAALLADQDPVRATVLARELLSKRPHDELALIAMARVMRAQGHMTEALLTAEQAYKLYPFSADAYSEAAYALIGLDRLREARALDKTASRLGLHCICGADIASYLDGEPIDAPTSASDLHTIFNRALSLDDSGQFKAAAIAWRAGADQAKSRAETTSAAAGMLAQAAVDRALANRCADVPAFAHEADLLPTGREAAFHIALAEGLCPSTQRSTSEAYSRLVASTRPHSTTSELLLPLVNAAQALSARQSMQALAALSKVESERDQFPTAAYLRGIARTMEAQDSLAIADFEQAGRRRGYAFLSHSTVSPLAVHRLSGVLATPGNASASLTAEREFHALWAKSDSSLIVDQPRPKQHGR